MPVQTFNTDAVDGKDRLEYWREVVAGRFLMLKPERCGLLPFRASMTVAETGALPVSVIRVQGQRVMQEVESAPEHGCFFVNLQATGAMRFGQAGWNASAAGSGFLIDSARPFTLDCPLPMTHICATLPRRMLLQRDVPLEGLGGVTLRRTQAPAALALEYLGALGFQPDRNEPMAAEWLADLVAYAVRRQNGASGRIPRVAIRAAVRSRAERLIRSCCDDPALSPAALARGMGLTLRTLQRIFRERDSTISECLTAARIGRAKSHLADPGFSSWSVAALGRACGFGDPAYFSRVFRERVGQSPAAYRKHLQEVDHAALVVTR